MVMTMLVASVTSARVKATTAVVTRLMAVTRPRFATSVAVEASTTIGNATKSVNTRDSIKERGMGLPRTLGVHSSSNLKLLPLPYDAIPRRIPAPKGSDLEYAALTDTTEHFKVLQKLMQNDPNLIKLQNAHKTAFQIEHHSVITKKLPTEDEWRFALNRGSQGKYRIYSKDSATSKDRFGNETAKHAKFTFLGGIEGDVEQLASFLAPPFNPIPAHRIVQVNTSQGSILIKGDYVAFLKWLLTFYHF